MGGLKPRFAFLHQQPHQDSAKPVSEREIREATPGVASVKIGSVWGGAGMTCRVIEAWDDGYSVLRLTGKGRVLKRPRERIFVPAHYFENGRLHPTAKRALKLMGLDAGGPQGTPPPTTPKENT